MSSDLPMVDNVLPMVENTSPYTRVYDPERKAVVRVPNMQAELLRHAGYAVGDDEARQRAEDDGWAAKAKVIAKNFTSGATAGLSDLAMPAGVALATQRMEQVHPALAEASKFAGTATSYGLSSLLGPSGIAARISMGAAQGATEEYKRAQEHNDPVQAERILAAAGLGAVTNGLLEGAGAVAPKLLSAVGKKTLSILDDVYPNAVEYADEIGTKFKYREAMLDSVKEAGGLKAIFGLSMLPGPVKGAVGSVVAADKAITGVLNNLDKAHAVLDYASEGPMTDLFSTVRALTEAKKASDGPDYVKDPTRRYKELSTAIVQAKIAPEAVAQRVSEMHDFSQHPLLQAGITMTALNQVATLYGALPTNPNDPTLSTEVYEPTDAQKRAFLDHYDVVTDLPKAMLCPNREKVMLAEQTNPQQMKLLKDSLLGYLAKNGTEKLSSAQLRNMSIILDTPVTPRQSMKYLKTLQQSAPPPQGKSPGGSPGLGVKEATNVTLRDMPDNMRLGMER